MARKAASAVQTVHTTAANVLPEARRTVYLTPEQVVIPTDPNERGRKFLPDDAAVRHLAYLLYTEGQQQPGRVRPIGDGKYKVTFGSTRAEAVARVRAGFEYEGKRYVNADMMFWAEVVEQDDKSARLSNRIENAGRTELSMIDHAHNITALMQEDGYKQADVVRLYGWDKSRVSRVLSLCELPANVQELIATGVIGWTIGVELAKSSNNLSEEEIAELAKLPELTVAKIQEYVRQRDAKPAEPSESGEGEGEGEGEGGGEGEEKDAVQRKRTLKQFDEWLAHNKYLDKGEFAMPVVMLFAAVKNYLDGGDSEQSERAISGISAAWVESRGGDPFKAGDTARVNSAKAKK